MFNVFVFLITQSLLEICNKVITLNYFCFLRLYLSPSNLTCYALSEIRSLKILNQLSRIHIAIQDAKMNDNQICKRRTDFTFHSQSKNFAGNV